jgi:hypothetical protein
VDRRESKVIPVIGIAGPAGSGDEVATMLVEAIAKAAAKARWN